MPSPLPTTIERARPLLGTVVVVQVEGKGTALVESAIAAAFDAMSSVQRSMSFHDPDSDLSRINRTAAHAPQAVCGPLRRVLRASLVLAQYSGGGFDPSVAGELVRRGQLPGPGANCGVDPEANWRDVELSRDGLIRYRKPLWLDLGGIAKGYAVDRAIHALRLAGMRSGAVNAGGDLRVFGDSMRTIRVRDPLTPSCARPLLQVRNGAVATSSGCFSIRDGHTALVDPLHRGSLGIGVSATVCAPRAIWADALTKIVLADAESSLSLLRRLHAQAIIVGGDGAMRMLQ
ncbi:MAG: FAD:protein FMN transferase [Luteimonas sp.]